MAAPAPAAAEVARGAHSARALPAGIVLFEVFHRLSQQVVGGGPAPPEQSPLEVLPQLALDIAHVRREKRRPLPPAATCCYLHKC